MNDPKTAAVYEYAKGVIAGSVLHDIRITGLWGAVRLSRRLGARGGDRQLHHHYHPSSPARRSRWLALLAVGLLALAGCGGATPASPAGTSSGASASSTTPSGGPSSAADAKASPAAGTAAGKAEILSWADVGIAEPPTLDPAKVGDVNSRQVIDAIFSGLVALDKNLKPIPDAAQKWDISPDGLTYTFHLRPNLAFSDGTAVTAEDFVYSLTRALSPKLHSPVAAIYLSDIVGAGALLKGKADTLAGVKAVDPHTLRIRISTPVAYFLDKLSYPTSYVVPRKVVEKYGNTWTDHAVGTGPFMIKQWSHKQSITLVPNPHWYGGKTQLTELRIPFILDQVTAWRQYQAGELDIGPVPIANLAQARKSPDYHDVSALYNAHLAVNLKASPFQNRDVRRAFAYAIDRNTLADKVMAGAVAPATGLIPPGMPGYNPKIVPLGFDPAKAKALLAKAGFPGGKGLPPISLAFSVASAKVGDAAAEAAALQQMWQQNLGIHVNINQVEFGTLLHGMQKGTWQFWMVTWTADYPDPQNLLSVALATKGPRNLSFYSNAQFDKLVQQADHTLNNDAERMKLYNQAEQIAINDAPWIVLNWPKIPWMVHAKVHGFAYNAEGLVPNWAWKDISVGG
ncbi:MAG: peptide ABC transporter substrate-binding protein [Chloroflexota bacterium]